MLANAQTAKNGQCVSQLLCICASACALAVAAHKAHRDRSSLHAVFISPSEDSALSRSLPGWSLVLCSLD